MWKITNQMEYMACVEDLMESPAVQAMAGNKQHAGISCLDHCIFVSYVSFLFCRRYGLDYMAAARGGLLHDLFLYDWHEKGSHVGLHGFTHPRAALENARALYPLSYKEEDIIVKHMWPLTLRKVPRFRESFVVCGADKLCALAEMFFVYRLMKIKSHLLRPAAGE